MWIFGLKVALVTGLYVGLQVTILLTTGDGWQKFWVSQPAETFEYWDAIHWRLHGAVRDRILWSAFDHQFFS